MPHPAHERTGDQELRLASIGPKHRCQRFSKRLLHTLSNFLVYLYGFVFKRKYLKPKPKAKPNACILPQAQRKSSMSHRTWIPMFLKWNQFQRQVSPLNTWVSPEIVPSCQQGLYLTEQRPPSDLNPLHLVAILGTKIRNHVQII